MCNEPGWNTAKYIDVLHSFQWSHDKSKDFLMQPRCLRRGRNDSWAQPLQDSPLAMVPVTDLFRNDVPWITRALAINWCNPDYPWTHSLLSLKKRNEGCLKKRGCLFSWWGINCSRQQLKHSGIQQQGKWKFYIIFIMNLISWTWVVSYLIYCQAESAVIQSSCF